MTKYEKGGLQIFCSKEELAQGKVSILDGFVNSKNPEKDKWLDCIAQEAALQPSVAKAVVDAMYDSWGVNGAKTFDVIGFEVLQGYLK